MLTVLATVLLPQIQGKAICSVGPGFADVALVVMVRKERAC